MLSGIKEIEFSNKALLQHLDCINFVAFFFDIIFNKHHNRAEIPEFIWRFVVLITESYRVINHVTNKRSNKNFHLT